MGQTRVRQSDRKNKKYYVIVNDKKIHFGHSDYRVAPGTKRGNNYCARSLGIAKQHNIRGDPTSPNYWARRLWGCSGKKSYKSKAIKPGDIVRY